MCIYSHIYSFFVSAIHRWLSINWGNKEHYFYKHKIWQCGDEEYGQKIPFLLINFKSLEKWYNFSDAQFLSQSKRERMNTELYFAFIIWRLSANECIIFIIRPGRSSINNRHIFIINCQTLLLKLFWLLVRWVKNFLISLHHFCGIIRWWL